MIVHIEYGSGSGSVVSGGVWYPETKILLLMSMLVLYYSVWYCIESKWIVLHCMVLCGILLYRSVNCIVLYRRVWKDRKRDAEWTRKGIKLVSFVGTSHHTTSHYISRSLPRSRYRVTVEDLFYLPFSPRRMKNDVSSTTTIWQRWWMRSWMIVSWLYRKKR